MPKSLTGILQYHTEGRSLYISWNDILVLGHSQLEAMTKRWFVEDHANQPHLWEEDTTVFDWLKSQLDPETGPSSVSQVPPGLRMLLM